MITDTKIDDRSAKIVLAEIETKLATIDGIAMSDAFTLGRLVHEYGERKAAELMSPIIGSLFDAAVKPRGPGETWRHEPL